MKKTQWIYKAIAAVLAIALALGLLAMGKGLQHKEPADISGTLQDILPEAEKTVTDSEDTLDGQTKPTTEPTTEPTTAPTTEPTTAPTTAPTTEPTTEPTTVPTSEPPKTEPTQTEPPQTEPSQTQPTQMQPTQMQPTQTEPLQTELPRTEPTAETSRTEPPQAEPEATEPDETLQNTEPTPDDDPGGNGDTDDGPGETVPDEGPEDDSELRVITDLHNGEITFNQLNNDVLPFYAYLINGNDLTLRVKLRNSITPANGKYLTGDGKNYEAALCRNETNFFTLYVKDGNTTVREVTYALRYVAQKADEDNPTVGNNPPTIVTNLEGVTQLSNRNFTFTVQATAYTGRSLYSSNIEVMLDGERITGPTGGPVYEYQLYFKDPDVGDIVHHTVTVRAWDDAGNSAYYSYNFDYHFVDTGGEIGTAYIILDMTTVGLGVPDEPYTYRIKQNVPASYAVMEMLTEYGYEFDYAGTPDVGFYLRRIHSGGMMDYPEIPENLWNKVLQDQLTLTGQQDNDSLGEFDFTQGSGWMFSVGGTVYAGKGLSNYFLNNGDTLYLRFTLAYGKDIGGYSSTGGNYGVLPGYCGKWINDEYIEMHQYEQIAGGADGCILYECKVCKQQKEETIPWQEMRTIPPKSKEEQQRS